MIYQVLEICNIIIIVLSSMRILFPRYVAFLFFVHTVTYGTGYKEAILFLIHIKFQSFTVYLLFSEF